MATVNGKDYHWCTGDHYSNGENILECMQTINQADMMHGAKIWMIIVQLVVLATSLPTKHQILLQQNFLKSKNLPSATNFVTLFVLKLDFQLRQLIASGRRSEFCVGPDHRWGSTKVLALLCFLLLLSI
jgi:hypothetical protein